MEITVYNDMCYKCGLNVSPDFSQDDDSVNNSVELRYIFQNRQICLTCLSKMSNISGLKVLLRHDICTDRIDFVFNQ